MFNAVRLVVILVVVGVLIALFGLPIMIAVHMHASAALMIEIIVGECIAFGVLCFMALCIFAKGMSDQP